MRSLKAEGPPRNPRSPAPTEKLQPTCSQYVRCQRKSQVSGSPPSTIFTTHLIVAATLPLINIDTGMTFPKQFLKSIARTGLRNTLSHKMGKFTPAWKFLVRATAACQLQVAESGGRGNLSL